MKNRYTDGWYISQYRLFIKRQKALYDDGKATAIKYGVDSFWKYLRMTYENPRENKEFFSGMTYLRSTTYLRKLLNDEVKAAKRSLEENRYIDSRTIDPKQIEKKISEWKDTLPEDAYEEYDDFLNWLSDKKNYDGKIPSFTYIYQRYNGLFHTEKRYREEMKRKCVKHIQEMPIKEVEKMESFLTKNIN